MIRPLVHDTIFLKIRAKDADAEDVQTAKDLAETLEHHKEGCVGMAANMIGVPKRIIVFYDSKKIITMFNPEITGKNQPYETEEGCLSLLGGPRSVTRYKSLLSGQVHENARKAFQRFYSANNPALGRALQWSFDITKKTSQYIEKCTEKFFCYIVVMKGVRSMIIIQTGHTNFIIMRNKCFALNLS